MKTYNDLAKEIGELTTEKNKAYGDSFSQAQEFLKLLYPNGIPVQSYSDMLCIVRIFDKLKRIATDKGAFSESPYRDIGGYALLGAMKDEIEKRRELEKNEKLVSPEEVKLLKD